MLTPDNSPLSNIFFLFSGASLSDQNGLAQVPSHSSVRVLDALLSSFIVAVQSLKCVWLFWDPMDCSTPGLPVHHHLLESAQTHVRRVGDAIQPSHPLSSPFSFAFSPSLHQGLFQWVGSLHQVVLSISYQTKTELFFLHFYLILSLNLLIMRPSRLFSVLNLPVISF